MSDQIEFDFAALEEEPAWAESCGYCVRDDLGHFDEAAHFRGHLPLTCDVCGETEPNRLLFGMSHGVNLGACWGEGWLLCSSLWLRLNHLTYALKTGTEPAATDLSAIGLGWTFAPDGERFAPAGWRSGAEQESMEPLERAVDEVRSAGWTA